MNGHLFEILEKLYGVDKSIGRVERSLYSAEVEYSPEFVAEV